jgi:homoserine O-acetyltransferase
MPSATDLYFRTADNELELASLRKAELVEIPSIWGHRAGSPADIPADLEFLSRHVRAFLEN